MIVRNRILVLFFLGLFLPVAAVVLLSLIGLVAIDVDFSGRSLVFGVGALALLVTATLLVLRALLGKVADPVAQMLAGIEEISHGNLSPTLPPTAPGELGVINEALRTMCGQMRMILSQLRMLSTRVVEATDRAGTAFDEVRDGALVQSETVAKTYCAVGELSEGLLGASREIEALAKRIDDGASAIYQMDVTICRVAENIGGLRTSIEEAIRTTRDGDKNVKLLASDMGDLSSRIETAKSALGQMISGTEQARHDARDATEIMGGLESETERIGKAIEAVIEGSNAVHVSNDRILEVTTTLESRVERVDDVIEFIRNLAERTKLLSINASIIASEAGEHGRAFAAVAHEIKDLAQSTAGAISEISKVVAGLKEGFAQTVGTIQKGQADVDCGVSLARDAVVLLHSIPEQVHRAAARNSEIAGRTETQVQKGREIEEIIGKILFTLNQVSELLSAQITRNDRTLALYHNIGVTSDQVLGSTREHAYTSNEVTRSVEGISADFRTLADLVRQHLASLGTVVKLSQDVVKITERSNKGASELSALIEDLNRWAQYLGDDFRKLDVSGAD
ncbi:MAG: methyl-accepting chemotaxis protein [Deltaproteobacteria bacterium]|nr:methyl-accepting chemotaxis protein [Deltaproteobacteria bacterium]